MPTLFHVPLRYDHEEGAKLLYELCAALVRERLGTVETWRACGKKCLVFAQRTIMQAIGEDRWNLLKRNVEYHLTISDTLDTVGDHERLPNNRLVAMIECSGCGYLKLGPGIAAMEKDTEGLGAAFYWELLHSCYRVMRIYDHEDALQYEENMREMVEHEEDATQQYEFPDVAKAIPACLDHDRKGDYSTRGETIRRVLRESRTGKYSDWIQRLRRLRWLARHRLGERMEPLEDDHYDSPPLPSLLVAFEDHDAIAACFDEEGQHMLEGMSEPSLLVCFDPNDQTDVRRAIRYVSSFIGFNHELFALAEELVQWEKNNAGTTLDRSNPQV